MTGTGKEQASGGASSDGKPLYELQKPISNFGEKVNIYKKVHKFMTFGLANTIIQPVPTTSVNCWLTSYLAEVPWHIPALYLNQSEFDLLDPGARVLECHIEVYYRGSTIQFETASTATGLATLNQINDIAVANGLNRSGQGSNISFRSFNSSQPMIPTSIAKPVYGPVVGTYRGMVRDYYGSNNPDTVNFKGDIPKHQVGRQTFLYNYFALSNTVINTTAPTPNRVQTGGWPNLAEKITQLDGKTAVNTCVVKSVYRPKQSPIKAPLRTIGHGQPFTYDNNSDMKVPVNGNLTTMKNNTPTQFSGAIKPDGYELNMNSTDLTPNNQVSQYPSFTIYSPIEKSQFTRTGLWGQADAHIQPSIHIGVQPVPALSTASLLTEDNQFNQWTDTRAYWEVIATLVVKSFSPTAYPYAAAANVPLGDNIIFGPSTNRPAVNIDPRDDGATVCGLYTTLGVGLPV